MSENTAFSASGEDVIARKIELNAEEITDDLARQDFEHYYDIDRTVQEIVQGNYKRIALQFPDELLHVSVPIYRLLNSRIGPGRELYVLADTSYGSCCVDEVAAQHVDADAMVHYGHACMSQTSRLPVIYVFGKKAIDPTDCINRLLEAVGTSKSTYGTFFLRTDVAYAHKADEVVTILRQTLPSGKQVVYTPIPLRADPVGTQAAPTTNDQDRISETSTDECILYIGGESLSLTNLLLTHASCQVYSYDPKRRTARLESGRNNKLLMKRYAVVQKARDADVFGILVGTLGVASYLPLISQLRSLLSRNHKKSYTISVGKLNPAKLANFLEIECFVLVACPENSLVEAKEFLRPIVTPYELEMALRPEPDWSGKYVLDFNKFLSGLDAEATVNGESSERDLDQPVFSLVTGKYRHAKRYGDTPSTKPEDDSNPTAVVLRNQDNTVALLSDSAAGQFLQSRTYQGLETRIGEDAPSILEQGRSGIARGYLDDHR